MLSKYWLTTFLLFCLYTMTNNWKSHCHFTSVYFLYARGSPGEMCS